MMLLIRHLRAAAAYGDLRAALGQWWLSDNPTARKNLETLVRRREENLGWRRAEPTKEG